MLHDHATVRRGARGWLGALLLTSAETLVAAPAQDPAPGSAAFTDRAGSLQESVMLSRGDGGMSGMALFRPVLQGVLYRAGFKGGDRAHTGLAEAQREALCSAGFSAARYVDFGSHTRFGTTQCAAGSFEYAKGSTASPGEILRQVHEVIEDPSRGPVLLHCMWGVHSSGAIAAMALVQFCGWSEERAKAYWHAARNDAPCSGGCEAWIDARFRRFAVDPAWVPTPEQQAAICPTGASSAAVRQIGDDAGAAAHC
jgi:hypothetical protein